MLGHFYFMRNKDMIGLKFGRLTVLSKNDNRKYYYDCICDCGKKTTVYISKLNSGHTKSCGCLCRENIGKSKTTHGLSWHELYNTWHHIKDRTSNKNNKQFKYWGGKGITVCESWKNSFPNFLKDMGERPSKNHSIDRIDCNKGYSKDNCRWADPKEQNRNKLNNVLVLNMETGIYYNTITEAAESMSYKKTFVKNNLYQNKVNKTKFVIV
jgi:hypothetical protein